MKINKNLEEEFNLAPMSLDDDTVKEMAIEVVQPATLDRYKELDKIEAALPQVCGLDATDLELDELANYAITAHKDLMDLSMNIEQRFAGEIAGAAANMLGHAVTARTNKIKKKLDMIALQIKKQVADGKTKSAEEPIDGNSTTFTRNELLAQLLKKPIEPDK